MILLLLLILYYYYHPQVSGAALAEVIAAVLGGQDGCLLSLGSSQSRPEQRWTMIGDNNNNY